MKQTIIILLSAFLWACASGGSNEKSSETEHDHTAQTASTEKVKSKSPKQMAMVNVGSNHIHIEYSSPSVRGRQIFGGLVAYGEVWVTGAHKATTISFEKDVEIDGTMIQSGKYGFFTIPGEETWTVIISKDWDMHLADDYNQDNDILRIAVEPQILEESTESLTYEVKEIEEDLGQVSMSWAEIRITFEVKNS